ncbi:MAG TPA: hypothetical protein VGP24_16570 [Glaciihabitans sp.]|nr:hypothetical protein [Glaciihabitans sp.]
MGAATILSALVGAFLIGHAIQRGQTKYPFLVTNSSGALTAIKAVPDKSSSTGHVVEAGDTVWVDCFIDQRDGRWYRLSDEQGWMRDRELLAAPHTGRGGSSTLS